MDKDMFLVHQAPTELLSSYLSKFKGAVDIVESSNGSPWSHPAATKIVFDELNDPAYLVSAKANNSSEYQLAATEVQWRYLYSSSTASATRPTGTSRRRSTTMPSRNPTLSLARQGPSARGPVQILLSATQSRRRKRGRYRLRAERQGHRSGGIGDCGGGG